ncbi:MAG: ribosome small subunit-dependent GTPase A [Rikenellaceae bacterium]|nr:ribosome small subunit-dependent GTPase A [Rikenellaceae bacterium]
MTAPKDTTPKSSTALVMRSAGSLYTLRDEVTGEKTEARLRGKIRLKGVRTTNPVAVGDIVEYETGPSGESMITEILPRRNYVIRRSPNLSRESHIIASNLDQAVIVATLFAPQTSMEFIDRFLVTCEAYSVPATIILNKCDLVEGCPEEAARFRDIYNLAGYRVIEVSALTGSGMDKLGQYLEGKTTLFSGNSGVGKSSLIQKFVPGEQVRTAEISGYHHKGRHTTTFARMYELSGGGYIIDTPGIKGFGLLEIEPGELYRYFPEMMNIAPGCKFYNCTHVHEPGCAVVEAVAEGRIADSRYIGYLKILEEDEKYRK